MEIRRIEQAPLASVRVVVELFGTREDVQRLARQVQIAADEAFALNRQLASDMARLADVLKGGAL